MPKNTAPENETPRDWGTSHVGDVCKIQSGFPFKSILFSVENGFPLIRIRDLKPNKTATYYLGEHEQEFVVKDGDILIGMDGDFQPCLWRGGEALLNQRVCRLMEFKDSVEKDYIFYAMHKPLKQIEDVTHYTTVKHLSAKQVRDIKLPAPPLPEQRSIASVLSKIQEAIAAQRETIDRTRELKKALMAKLFTEGLRGEPTKETEIGPIPESWEVMRLEQVTKIERGKFSHRPRNDPDFYGGDIPFIQTGDVTRSGGRICEYSQTLNELGLSVSRIFSAGTILITIAANIGDTGILQFDSAFPDSIIGLTPFVIMDSEFLEYYLRTQKDTFDRLAPRGTQKNINIEFLRPWLVPVPKIEEQKEIATIFNMLSEKEVTSLRKRSNLDDLFKTMLHELMTGNIRTTPLMEA